MRRRIFLGGGGDTIQSKEIDELYGHAVGQGGRVLYIPVALGDSYDFSSCLNWFMSAYQIFSFKVEMLTDLSTIDFSRLEQFESIYIGGGKTFDLLQRIKETNFIDLLRKFINSGKIVYGGSAGAIILGKDISTASLGKCSDTNEVNITDLSGLDVVNGYAVHCHYDGEEESVQKFAFEHDLKIIAISEDGGVFIDGDEIKVVGDIKIIESP